jgi:hypothetical protein
MSIHFVTLNQRLRAASGKMAAGSGFRGFWIPLGGFLGFPPESTLPLMVGAQVFENESKSRPRQRNWLLGGFPGENPSR